jgi:hypothetical protein
MANQEIYKVKKLWGWMPMAGITIFHTIFLKDPEDYIAHSHELVHMRQQMSMGWKFWFLYIFWPPSRARLEAEAYANTVQAGVPIEGLADSLSGPLYLWCCSRAKALELIKGYLV